MYTRCILVYYHQEQSKLISYKLQNKTLKKHILMIKIYIYILAVSVLPQKSIKIGYTLTLDDVRAFKLPKRCVVVLTLL